MHSLVRRIFHRLQTLDPIEEEKRLIVNFESPVEGEVKMSVQSLQDLAQVDSERTSLLEILDEEKPHDTPEETAMDTTSTAEPAVETSEAQPDVAIQRADCKLYLPSLSIGDLIQPCRWVALNRRTSTSSHQHPRSKRSPPHRFDASDCTTDTQHGI